MSRGCLGTRGDEQVGESYYLFVRERRGGAVVVDLGLDRQQVGDHVVGRFPAAVIDELLEVPLQETDAVELLVVSFSSYRIIRSIWWRTMSCSSTGTPMSAPIMIAGTFEPHSAM